MSRGLTWLKDGGEQKDLLLIIISALPARLRNQRGRFLSRGKGEQPLGVWFYILNALMPATMNAGTQITSSASAVKAASALCCFAVSSGSAGNPRISVMA